MKAEAQHFGGTHLDTYQIRMIALWDATNQVLGELEVDRELHEIIQEETGERAECPTCDRVMALLRTTTDIHKTVEMPVIDEPRTRRRIKNIALALVATIGLAMGGSLGAAVSIATSGPQPTSVTQHHPRRRSAPSTRRDLVLVSFT